MEVCRQKSQDNTTFETNASSRSIKRALLVRKDFPNLTYLSTINQDSWEEWSDEAQSFVPGTDYKYAWDARMDEFRRNIPIQQSRLLTFQRRRREALGG